MAIKKTYGIDVSYHQGVIDWQTVKASGVEWVVLRAGFGFNTIDTKFVDNIKGAIAAGFDEIGVYWFCYSHNTDDIAIEAASCLAAIEPYKEYIKLPVFFDFEGASYTYVKNTYGVSLTASDIQELASAWCDAITAAGYSTGIYSNKSDGDKWFKLQSGLYLWQKLGVAYWYARYGANDETSLFITPAFEQTALSEHPEMKIFQYSDQGRIDGINSTRVDLNIRYENVVDPPEPPTPTPVIITSEPKPHIEYVEIRDNSFNVVGIVDTASSIIWHSTYYSVGDFEIYIRLSSEILNLLKVGYYVTRPDNAEIGIIEALNIANDLEKGTMIAASGRFAKSILDRRLIYNLSGTSNTPTILSGNVETAIRNTVQSNAINCLFDTRRNFSKLELGAIAGISKTIVDEDGNATQKQVSYQNLLEYTDGVLEEYEMASRIILNADTKKLQYIVYQGTDRSTDNNAGNQPLIFSREFDNLTNSEYGYDTTAEKNTALIGGEGEGIDRFYSLFTGNQQDFARREIWIDGSSLNKTYKDDSDTEQTYSDTEYKKMLDAKAKQDMCDLVIVESFKGTIDITNGNWVYNRDFSLGDIVTVQDKEINKLIDVRIREITEVQDENGYSIEATYE